MNNRAIPTHEYMRQGQHTDTRTNPFVTNQRIVYLAGLSQRRPWDILDAILRDMHPSTSVN